MFKKKLSKEELIAVEDEYVKFLKKMLNSQNYKDNATVEEYAKTKAKYDKAKLKLKFLKM